MQLEEQHHQSDGVQRSRESFLRRRAELMDQAHKYRKLNAGLNQNDEDSRQELNSTLRRVIFSKPRYKNWIASTSNLVQEIACLGCLQISNSSITTFTVERAVGLVV